MQARWRIALAAAALAAGGVYLLGQSGGGGAPRTVEVEMRDGVSLATDLYGADDGRPRPVLLQRTPYDRTRAAEIARRYAASGYAVVVQDTRGRFDSGGDFFPYNNEGQDGFDTFDWIARQPWSDGRVGTWGASYVGAVQYQAAAERAPGLAVMAPTATWSSFYRNIYHGGVSRLALIATASAGLYPPPDGREAPADWFGTLKFLPLAKLDEAVGWRIPWLTSILAHPAPDGYWDRLDLTERVDRLAVPAQHVVGYYDFFSRETTANFQRLSKASDARQELILGPWDHGSIGKTTLGDVDFGSAAAIDLVGENLAWFDRILKGAGKAEAPRVRYFSMGDNVWRTAGEWPPADAKPTPYYLTSGGRANTRSGDGLLSTAPPQSDEPADRFRADPNDPVPAWPPALLEGPFRAFWGPADQGPIEDRDDVLIYDLAEATEPLRFAGSPTAELWVEHDTPDADWVVKLVDVAPDGYAQNLAVGIQRARFRDDAMGGSDVTPNQPYRLQVDLGPVAASIQPGHTLRIEVTSAYFPLFDRNPNTGEGPWSSAVRMARQTVHHRPARASRVLLPVLP